MKVLYYNWAPIDAETSGGGVGVYLRNIAKYCASHKSAHQIEPAFISSGYYYSSHGKAYFRKESDYLGFHNYSIINSPVPSPMRNAFASMWNMEKDDSLLELFCQIINAEGEINVLHFESLEGISINVLRIKERFPNIKIVHSIHDYGIICPKVMLWNNYAENCFTHPSSSCYKCLSEYVGLCHDDMIEKINGDALCQSIGRKLFRKLSRLGYAYYFTSNRYRNMIVKSLNKYSDLELCVSNRVQSIVTQYGLNSSKAIVDYIGTEIASVCEYSNRTPVHSEYFSILFMGYANIPKGFYLFLDFLFRHQSNCNKIIIKIAAALNSEQKNQIETLRRKFHNIEIFNGYSHSDFPTIMKGVNVGIVAPLWEDNFPQVGIELVANGIPVITSIFGGACELNTNPLFHFSDVDDLSLKIDYLMENREELDNYWLTSMRLVTMEQHIMSLLHYYSKRL